MLVIYLLIIGCGVFAMSSLVLGAWLKGHPSKKAAETTSRIMNVVLFSAVIFPMCIGFSYPGLRHYDALLGLPALPFPTISLAVGGVMTLTGSAFLLISILVLLDRGEGFPAFVLSKKLAVKDLYRRTRNPMSLGFYLFCIGIGIFAGSTFFTMWSLLALIPAHVFFLKYFEECELGIRFGQSYGEYKRTVPFLIPNIRRRVSGSETLKNNESG